MLERRPIAPVTKAEVETEKERLRAIDARPIKKIAEAKARRKQKLVKRLDQARHKANVSCMSSCVVRVAYAHFGSTSFGVFSEHAALLHVRCY